MDTDVTQMVKYNIATINLKTAKLRFAMTVLLLVAECLVIYTGYKQGWLL